MWHGWGLVEPWAVLSCVISSCLLHYMRNSNLPKHASAFEAWTKPRCTKTQQGKWDLTYCRRGGSSGPPSVPKTQREGLYSRVTQATCSDQAAIYYLRKQDPYLSNNPFIENKTVLAQEDHRADCQCGTITLMILLMLEVKLQCELHRDERTRSASRCLKILFILMCRF